MLLEGRVEFRCSRRYPANTPDVFPATSGAVNLGGADPVLFTSEGSSPTPTATRSTRPCSSAKSDVGHGQRAHHLRHHRHACAPCAGTDPLGPVAACGRCLNFRSDSIRAIPRRDDGFSLLEVMVALSILMVGLLGLAQVFYFGVSIAATSSAPSSRARKRAKRSRASTRRATRGRPVGRDSQRSRRRLPRGHHGEPPTASSRRPTWTSRRRGRTASSTPTTTTARK